MKKFVLFVLAIVLLFSVASCTEQKRAFSFGGNMNYTLNPFDNLWFLTRPMELGEKPITYQFKESSSLDVWEGVVTIKERANLP